MNQRQLASVCFGVGGIFLMVSRLPEIVIYVAMLTQWSPFVADQTNPVSERSIAIIGLGGMLLVLLLGLGLVLLRDALATRLFPSGTQSMNGSEIQAVAFSVLGGYFAIHGVAKVYQLGRLNWVAAAELALGLGLFLGSRGLARVWAQLHSATSNSGASGSVL